MKTTEPKFRERVVKMQEFCEGKLFRTFYCIYDLDFRHWMSQEPFDGLLWTKDITCRQEFGSRKDARAELEELRDWRVERDERARDPLCDIPFEREAA